MPTANLPCNFYLPEPRTITQSALPALGARFAPVALQDDNMRCKGACSIDERIACHLLTTISLHTAGRVGGFWGCFSSGHHLDVRESLPPGFWGSPGHHYAHGLAMQRMHRVVCSEHEKQVV